MQVYPDDGCDALTRLEDVPPTTRGSGLSGAGRVRMHPTDANGVPLTHAFDESDAEVEVRSRISELLASSRRAGRQRRLRASGLPFAIFVVSTAFLLAVRTLGLQQNFNALISVFTMPSYILAYLSMLFVLTPDDGGYILVPGLAMVMLQLYTAADWLSDVVLPGLWNADRAACGAAGALLVHGCGLGILAALYVHAAGLFIVHAARWTRARITCAPGMMAMNAALLDALWFEVARVNRAMVCSLCVISALYSFYFPGHVGTAAFALQLATIAFSACGWSVATHTSLRRHVQAWLVSRGSDMSAAAGVAVLLESHAWTAPVDVWRPRAHPQRPDATIRRAKAALRGVQVSDLTLADLCPSTVAEREAAYSRSRPAKLGEVDAFVCHSWHDPPRACFLALRMWAAGFRAQHGREPVVWLDVACLPREGSAYDLANLPLFLAACNRMVVLRGPTVFARLWCALEIFTWGHVCPGKPLVLAPLPGFERTAHSEDVTEFDAWQCMCRAEADRVHLLLCFEAAGGTRAVFNQRMREQLKRAAVDADVAQAAQEERNLEAEFARRVSSASAAALTALTCAPGSGGSREVVARNPPSALHSSQLQQLDVLATVLGMTQDEVELLEAESRGYTAGAEAPGAGGDHARGAARSKKVVSALCSVMQVLLVAIITTLVMIRFSERGRQACRTCPAHLSLLGAVDAPGAPGWYRMGESEYAFRGGEHPSDARGWADANQECARHGGTLAGLQTREEGELAQCLAAGIPWYWIGLSGRAGKDSDVVRWQWEEDNSTFVHHHTRDDDPRGHAEEYHENWIIDSPDHKPPWGIASRSCVHVLGAGWHTARPCEFTMPFICERPVSKHQQD